MRLLIFTNVFFFISCSLTLSLSAHDHAELQQFTKTVSRSFQFTNSTPDITFQNKYGNITLSTTNNKSAEVMVTIIVEAKDEKRADEIFKRIQIDFDHGNNDMSAVTTFNDNKGWGWAKKNEHYNVHYDVSVPVSANLRVSNKYGDINMQSHDGPVSIDLRYGSANAIDFGGALNLDIAYVEKMSIGSVKGNVSLKCAYSNFHAIEISKMKGESKYSRYYFERLENLELESKYDHFNIDELITAKINGKYNDLKIGILDEGTFEMTYTSANIEELKKTASFVTKHGNVTINNVSNIAEEITIESQYTDYKLLSISGVNIDLDTKYTLVRYPDELEFTTRIEDSSSLKLVSKPLGRKSVKIKAVMKYGSLRIRD